jgi:hypothetical protein
MLSFSKTSIHPFMPMRLPASNGYNLFTPHQIHLLAGQTVTVDWLVAIVLPAGHRGDLKLKPTGQKLLLHSQPLCEWWASSLKKYVACSSLSFPL